MIVCAGRFACARLYETRRVCAAASRRCETVRDVPGRCAVVRSLCSHELSQLFRALNTYYTSARCTVRCNNGRLDTHAPLLYDCLLYRRRRHVRSVTIAYINVRIYSTNRNIEYTITFRNFENPLDEMSVNFRWLLLLLAHLYSSKTAFKPYSYCCQGRPDRGSVKTPVGGYLKLRSRKLITFAFLVGETRNYSRLVDKIPKEVDFFRKHT